MKVARTFELIPSNFKFAGGSVLNYLNAAIPRIKTDLKKFRFFFCDERFVPEADADSTYGAYKSKLIPSCGLSESQFFAINLNLSLAESARDYEQRMLKHFALAAGDLPSFDVLLLGMGPDGHTCSLFPQHRLLQETQKLIADIDDSPKPPPQRLTMTFPLINNAQCCIFAMCGAGKAEMVKVFVFDYIPCNFRTDYDICIS